MTADGTYEAAAYLDVLEAEGALLALTAQTSGLAGEVPFCPGWRMRELVTHVGWVYRWVATVVGDRRTEPPTQAERSALSDPDPADDQGVLDRLRFAHATIVTMLRDAPPDLACWTPWPAPPSRDFWIRRQVHESLVHRVDAQNAARGTVAGGDQLPAALAADGVDEMICGFAVRYQQLRADRPGTLALRATDTGGSWWARLTPDGPPAFGRGPAPGGAPEAEVHAAAGELLLLLWNRRAADGLDVRGDRDLLAAWRRGAHL